MSQNLAHNQSRAVASGPGWNCRRATSKGHRMRLRLGKGGWVDLSGAKRTHVSTFRATLLITAFTRSHPHAFGRAVCFVSAALCLRTLRTIKAEWWAGVQDGIAEKQLRKVTTFSPHIIPTTSRWMKDVVQAPCTMKKVCAQGPCKAREDTVGRVWSKGRFLGQLLSHHENVHDDGSCTSQMGSGSGEESRSKS